jgi:transcriptional regulator with XRE-family HTH domain
MNIKELYKSDAQSKTRTQRPSLTPELGRQIGRFRERLKSITDDESLRGFGRKAGISDGALRHYLNGDSFPDLDRLAAIAEQANVNLLWLATGEGPKHPQARGSPDSVQEKSADYVCEPQKGWIRKAVEAVEMMGKDAPADRKAVAVEQVYGRLVQSNGAADMIEVMRIIQAALEG